MNKDNKDFEFFNRIEENLRSEFFAKDVLLEVPYKIGRVDDGENRYYYVRNGGYIDYFLSTTTIIKSVLPVSNFLIEWISRNGLERSKELSRQAADFGILMHREHNRLLINREYNLDVIRDVISEYCESNYINYNVSDWSQRLKKSLLSWAQFIYEYDIKPIAVEIPLVSHMRGYAGCIDLVCKMNVEEKGFWGEVYKTGEKKGEPKESKRLRTIHAIVDMKSGMKGFYEDHEFQLHLYKDLWEDNFPEIKIDALFNWSPKDWETSPTYNIKDQTRSEAASQIGHMLELAKLRLKPEPRGVLCTSGTIRLDDETLKLNYVYKSIIQAGIEEADVNINEI